ncbi:nitrogenase component 1 [Schwartzia sp. (in: firmicutes)]
MKKPFFKTAAELAALGKENIPAEFRLDTHLIYNSPAALDFNSPGAQGYGVKRAGLAVPGSVMLLIAPRSCGRNTSGLAAGDTERFGWLLMDETDIVTGRHLKKIPEAVSAFVDARRERPSVVMLCITCVDALLGTDMERVCRKAEEAVGLPVRPCYMYALTRDSRKPPMAAVRETVYSLLEPRRKNPRAVNLMGYFAPLADDSDLYEVLRSFGLQKIRELGRCRTMEEYEELSEANFNLLLSADARDAAAMLEKKLSIPSVEITRLYEIDKIESQYKSLAQALGAEYREPAAKKEAEEAVSALLTLESEPVFAIGSRLNANAFELSLALVRYGLKVAEIYGDPQPQDIAYIRRLSELSPDTRIFSNLSPTMAVYDETQSSVTVAVGRDAEYYHENAAHVPWSDEIQPFGFSAVRDFCRAVISACEGKEQEKQPQKAVSGEEIISNHEIRGLRLALAPFAPDTSGAAAVLFPLDALTVIIDAGGCAGNICGFDEPRWDVKSYAKRSTVFSAGLRDMDAIMGRDDRLMEKLALAAEDVDASFAALIGTPVPAVIGTDYRALVRLIEKKLDMPAVAVDTDGTKLYDDGASKTWEALVKTFASEGESCDAVGVIGVTPLDFSEKEAENIHASLGEKAILYGWDGSIENIKRAGLVKKNYAVTASGIRAAKYIEKKFGVPYEIMCPLSEEEKNTVHEAAAQGGRVLVVHEPVRADAFRKALAEAGTADVTVGTWFTPVRELSKEGDVHFKEETQFARFLEQGNFSCVIADNALRKAAPGYRGAWLDAPHFAVSGGK